MTQPDPRDETSDIHLVEDPAALRALASPERRRILDLLTTRRGTAKQLADWVGGTPGRVHYHVKALEKAGLVRIVARQERGGVVEKFYRAVARNVYLTQGIGEQRDLTGEVHDALSRRMLDWRRERVLEVDQTRVASRIVRDGLAVEAGQVVLVHAAASFAPILETLHEAIDDAGAHAIISFPGRMSPAFVREWTSRLAAAVLFEPPLDEATTRAPLDDAPPGSPERTQALDALLAEAAGSGHASIPGESALVTELVGAGVRTLLSAYPTPDRARRAGVSLQTLHDAFWLALDVDYTALASRCREVAARLRDTRHVRLRSTQGTDLAFEIEPDPVFVDDGVIDDEEVRKKRGFNMLPAGKVLVGIRAGSARGTLHSEATDFRGVPLRDIRLEIHEGEVVAGRATENEDLLERLLATAPGGRPALGAFEIGMNPRILEPIGHAAWDQKANGRATIGLGSDAHVSGSLTAGIAWNVQVDRCRITLDDEPFDGEHETRTPVEPEASR